jgi:single-strand DNA-binding protein
MQTITVEGYLAADPAILAAQGSGKKRATFRLLETTRFRRGDGELGERTTGFNCLCFSEAAAENYIAPHARKGSRVVVSGHVENDTWTGQDGVVHYDLRLVVENLRIKRRRDDMRVNDGARPRPEAPEPDVDDEIPF